MLGKHIKQKEKNNFGGSAQWKMKVFFKKCCIKIRLSIIRFFRRIRVLFPRTSIGLYSILIIFWLLFALASYCITTIHDKELKTYLRTLWELKNSIFSSVVLAFVIGAFNHVNDYKKTLKRQHFLYVDTMDAADKFLRAMYRDDIWQKFYPLYNEKCLNICLDYLEDRVPELNSNDTDFVRVFDGINEIIKKIEIRLKDEMLLVKDEQLMEILISSAKEKIIELLLEMDIEAEKKHIHDFIFILFEIVEELRYLWRRDVILDVQLIKCYKNPEKDFYKRMWLPDICIDDVKGWE